MEEEYYKIQIEQMHKNATMKLMKLKKIMIIGCGNQEKICRTNYYFTEKNI